MRIALALILITSALLPTTTYATLYACKFIVGWPAGSGKVLTEDFDSDAGVLADKLDDYSFVVQSLAPKGAGNQIQVRIFDPYGGLSTANFQDGYLSPFVASRHDYERTAAQISCRKK